MGDKEKKAKAALKCSASRSGPSSFFALFGCNMTMTSPLFSDSCKKPDQTDEDLVLPWHGWSQLEPPTMLGLTKLWRA